MKKINPHEGKKKLKVWFWYWPEQLDQVGRKGACSFVYTAKPTKLPDSPGAILMTATAVETASKPTPKPSRRARP